MFTGLITDLGTIIELERTPVGATLSIAPSRADFPLSLGASIACDGVCLTVTDHKRTFSPPEGEREVASPALQLPWGDSSAVLPPTKSASGFDSPSGEEVSSEQAHQSSHCFTAHLSAETLRVTTAQLWKTGDMLNLEPSLKLGDALGGHLVSGHVDGVGKVISVTPQGESEHWVFEAPAELMPFIAVKGSITINGISLTVNQVLAADVETKKNNSFAVMIIPHTRNHTNLQHKRAGDAVNLEIDLLARYVARILETRAA